MKLYRPHHPLIDLSHVIVWFFFFLFLCLSRMNFKFKMNSYKICAQLYIRINPRGWMKISYNFYKIAISLDYTSQTDIENCSFSIYFFISSHLFPSPLFFDPMLAECFIRFNHENSKSYSLKDLFPRFGWKA